MGKVLIAEDDSTQQRILLKAVEKTGHMAIVAADGQMALDIISTNPGISLLITDVVMPKVDGRELITQLRGEEKYKELPIIIISGVVGIKEIGNLLEMGASRFLPKPIKISEITEYINRLVKD